MAPGENFKEITNTFNQSTKPPSPISRVMDTEPLAVGPHEQDHVRNSRKMELESQGGNGFPAGAAGSGLE